MSRRILIAPDKFKGSLSAGEAAAAMAAGIRQLDAAAELDICPIADGGEGFMESVAEAMGARWIHCQAVDALGREIDSRYALGDTPDGPVAVLEMAETAGLWRLAGEERDPLRATTRGVGMQMVHAVREYAVTRIILGLGGSATNDGGCGMAAATGVTFLDSDGNEIDPHPATMGQLSGVDTGSRIELPEITAACDVDNPLLGVRGATMVFSAQKGSSEATRPIMEQALTRLVEVSGGKEAALKPGAGAAGGLGFGLLHFTKAELLSGFDLLAGMLNLESRVRDADMVLTGEGSIDRQSLSGKGPVALAKLARENGVPVAAFCGVADESVRASGLFDGLHALADTGLPLEQLIARAAPLLTEAVANADCLKG